MSSADFSCVLPLIPASAPPSVDGQSKSGKPACYPLLGYRLRLGRIGDLNDQIPDRLRRAAVARDRVQRAGRLVERPARPELLQRTVADFHFVAAFEHVAEGVAAGVAVRTAAGPGIALEPADGHF